VIPRDLNAARWFVDRHIEEGRDGRLAITYEGHRLSYGDVYAGANRLGNVLRRLGVRREQRVVLLLHDSPEFVWSFWGALKIGAVPVPTNTLLKPRDYEYILKDSRATVVIASEPLVAAVEEVRSRSTDLAHVVVVGRPAAGQLAYDELADAESAELAPAPTTKDDVAFWQYTSGTTGTPKAAVHLHHDMLVCCEAFGRHVLEIGPEDRTFSVAKLFFAYGLGNALYFPFHVGASTILYPGRPEPAKVFDVITRERPTLFYAVPTAFAAMLQVPHAERLYDLGSIRVCSSAGEPLPKAIYERWLEKFGLEILDGIGSTEMCHTFIANRRGSVRPGSSGTAVPGYEAKLVDDDGREVAVGNVGNLMVKGDSACSGYWNQHERTKQTIEGEWVRTGDKYTRDADGYFWYAGRSDDMIKAGGMWVSPAEVESALAEHPAVVESGVVGAEDKDELVKPLAFVVLARGQAASPALEVELKAFVKERLAPYKYPRWIVFVDELPKTATGKIQRFRLRELASRRTGEAGGRSPEDPNQFP
jgi:benzoate-CoA ligase